MAKRANPGLLSDRAKRDKTLRPELDRVWKQNYKVYGVRKVWHQMRREGIISGKKTMTTIPDKALPCRLDKVNPQFRVPARACSGLVTSPMWRPLPGSTCKASARGGQGFVYFAFVIDAFASCIVGWRVSRTAHAGFVLDALEQAVHQRRSSSRLVYCSDRGSQYLSIKYT